jgi:molybdopterin converting factor small subunit
MHLGTIKLEFWMSDRLGWTGPEPMIIEEPLIKEDTLYSVLKRLASKMRDFPESVFDPKTHSLSSEVTIVLNDTVQNMSDGIGIKLKEGDHILFLPILAGGSN